VYRRSERRKTELKGHRVMFFYGKGNEYHQLGTGFSYKRVISAVRKVQSVSDRMSYIILRGGWCNIVVLNVHAPCEDKSYNVKDSFYEELARVFDQFYKYNTKILLGDFYAKVGREDIFKPTIGNESSHEISNDNGVRVVNSATSKILIVKSTMFPHRSIHKYTWTSPNGQTHNQVDHFLIDRRWHSSILDVQFFRGADCDTDHYLVVARIRERLAVSKQHVKKMDMNRFKLKKLNDKVLGIINQTFKPSLVSRHTRICIYKTLARPVLSYGSEACAIRRIDEKRLISAEMRFLRRTAGWDHKRNKDILTEL
jgi:hypothetical protein